MLHDQEYNLLREYEEQMEHRKWIKEIPYLQFPADWKVKITPPFAGAVVRFGVEKGGNNVSVYLDCYDKLGCYGSPYWEVYPYNDDVFRCDISDVEGLLAAIAYSLSEQINHD